MVVGHCAFLICFKLSSKLSIGDWLASVLVMFCVPILEDIRLCTLYLVKPSQIDIVWVHKRRRGALDKTTLVTEDQ